MQDFIDESHERVFFSINVWLSNFVKYRLVALLQEFLETPKTFCEFLKSLSKTVVTCIP